MSEDAQDPQVMWEGRYIRAMKAGRWEFTSRSKGMTAVVILAEVDGKVLLVEQRRVPIGKRCIELPAGLVGDEDEDATVLGTAEKELLEETGYKAERFELLGEYYSSPGMIAESFTLVRATGLSKVTEGGGNDEEEIVVHQVARSDVPAFLERMRGEGKGIDVRLLLLLGPTLA
jgi:ADP-ribose pyrophosphatase